MLNKSIKKIILVLSLVSSTLLAVEPDVVREGKADLSNWNPTEQDTVNLQGQWEFYWSQLLTPEDFQNQTVKEHSLIRVPGSWNKDKIYSDKGFATYRLRVSLARVQQIGILLPWIVSSSRVYIDNKLVHVGGRVGKVDDRKIYQAGGNQQYLNFTPNQKDFEIVVQAANFELSMAGIARPIKMGTPAAILKEQELATVLGTFLFGSLFIMAIYHLCLFALRTKDRSTFYFGLVLIGHCCYILGDKYAGILLFIPDISFSTRSLLFNTWVPIIPFYAYFARELFPQHCAKNFPHWFAALCFPIYILVLTTEPSFYIPFLKIPTLAVLACSFYVFYMLIRAIRARTDGAQLFIGGLTIYFLSIINDLLLVKGVIQSVPLLGLGLFVFVCFQSLLLARRFSNAFVHNEYLMVNLEGIVQHKTKEIRALLDHIPQGVLSIGPDGVIARDYSAHLLEILERDDIAEANFKEIFLDHLAISSDTKDQIWQSIFASIGEDILTFEVNSEKLGMEYLYQVQNRGKYLKATWNAEIEQGVVARLLLTLLDVTNEKKLEKESEAQRQELTMIQELVNIPAHSVAQFFASSLPLLVENEQIIGRSSTDLSEHDIRMLFVNAHTIKGAARTLRLKNLARVIHDTEEQYSNVLRKSQPAILSKMQSDIAKTREVFQHYIAINVTKLNRTTDFSTVNIDREFIENHYQIIKDLIDSPNVEVLDIVTLLKQQSFALTRLIFDQLPAVFEDYKDQARKIAKDIDRAEPIFDFNIDDISITPTMKILLNNTMIHLLRNALDHGIESPAERRKNNKPESGLIHVRATCSNKLLVIVFSDDGRGLGIGRLRERGEIQGKLAADTPIQEVADYIFQTGVSTAQKISEISGRGIGMSAVRSFLKEYGGSIAIKLGKPTDDTMQYYSFYFEIVMPFPAEDPHKKSA